VAAPGEIVIAEVMYDLAGSGGEPEGEWVTLYNRSDRVITLRGWSLRDARATSSLPEIVLPPRGFALIAASPAVREQFGSFDGVWVELDGRIGNGLGNTGDELHLLDASGQTIDALSWGDNTNVFAPAVKRVKPGETLRRRLPQDTDSAADWEPLPPGADARNASRAPGIEPLSGAPPQIEIGTRDAVTHAAVALTHGRLMLSEVAPRAGWIELYNPRPEPVDLHGWRIVIGESRSVALESSILDGHGFWVVDLLPEALPNGATIQLLRPDGSVADLTIVPAVTQGASWSRYPAHGGGWQAGTPPTRGTFNQPAPATPTPTWTPAPPPPPADASLPATVAEAAMPTESAPDRRLIAAIIALALCGGVGLGALRHAPPSADASQRARCTAAAGQAEAQQEEVR